MSIPPLVASRSFSVNKTTNKEGGGKEFSLNFLHLTILEYLTNRSDMWYDVYVYIYENINLILLN